MSKRIFFRKGKRVGLAILEESDLVFCLTALNDEEVTLNHSRLEAGRLFMR